MRLADHDHQTLSFRTTTATPTNRRKVEKHLPSTLMVHVLCLQTCRIQGNEVKIKTFSKIKIKIKTSNIYIR